MAGAYTIIERTLAKISPLYSRRHPGIVESVEEARKAWHQAQHELNFIKGEMIDHVIFKINATERRYVALLLQARTAGACAWPEAELKTVSATGATEKHPLSQ
jgi:hypothetical protein